jgi:EF-P beta-lysylation protein EpmB
MELRHAVRDLSELAGLLELPGSALAGCGAASSHFPLLVPRSYIQRMRRGDIGDPLLRQVLPLAAEQVAVPGFSADPLLELRHTDGAVIQKYPGRALVITTAACPVHCRYCFRREFPYTEQSLRSGDAAAIIEQLAELPSLTEVILSGGDPFSLSNKRLAELIGRLTALPRLTTLRIHTRFPILIPSRVDDELCELLSATPLSTVVVVHTNHANEIDTDVVRALSAMKRATSQLLNQSVLLAGINDNVETLSKLSRRLFAAGALPYYLHLLDPVSGAAHFEVEEARARQIIAGLRAELPGYLVPRLVRDLPGESGKTLIG